MANILLTTRCNLRCKYCFAQEKLSAKLKHMSLENVRKAIAFLKRSEFPLFRVMGGEPTIHPNFIEILRMVLDEGFSIDVLSNATWSEKCGEFFNRIPSTHLRFLLNIDHPSNYKPKIWATVRHNLEMLRGRSGITLSFNLFEKRPRGDYVIDLANEFNIKHIRLSLSLPVLNAENSFLPIEELPQLAPYVMKFVKKAENRGIAVRFDNAVPLCMFTSEQAGKLLLHGVIDLSRNARCEPIIDIGPDLSIWSCFCLSSLANRNLVEFDTLADAKRYYAGVWEVYQGKVYPMEKCINCLYREKWNCQGGCLTYALNTDHGERYRQPKESEAEMLTLDSKLALADDVTIRRYDLPVEKFILTHTSSGDEYNIGQGLQTILPLLDGKHTIAELAEYAVDDVIGSKSYQVFIRDTARQTYPKIFRDMLKQGFLKEMAT